MALFKSAEEKEQIKEEKTVQMLRKYGLEHLSDPRDVESVKKIVSELTGTGLLEAGIALGGGNEKDILRTQMQYERAIVEQNFIIIRLLDRLTK